MDNDFATKRFTSISQVPDIETTDWFFSSMQSAIERYGVVAGYPDGSFRPNRAMTRAEAVVLVNAALDRINELIANETADFVNKDQVQEMIEAKISSS